MNDSSNPPCESVLHQPALHDSGYRHATGQAQYVDDLSEPRDVLWVRPVVSPHPHAKVAGIDASAALSEPDVVAVFTAADIPGHNDISAVAGDEELLATDEVHCIGQAVALVVARSEVAARDAAKRVEVTYEELPAITTLPEAVRRESFLSVPYVIARGDVGATLARCAVRLEGEVQSGGQDHFYLEAQAAMALPGEDSTLKVYSSTQHPTEVQAKVAELLGLGAHQVVVECPRMGGAFGGKETQAAQPATMAALAAFLLGRPVKIRYDRDQDMNQTGKRHPWLSRYEAGFDAAGRLEALRVYSYSDGGFSMDLSRAVLQRCLFHLDSSYFVEHVHFEARVARTNLPSNTAFRGFGGPQGMLVADEIMNRAAERLGMDPAELRRMNYYGDAPRDTTPYGQAVKGNRLPRIHQELMDSSDYARRRAEIEAFNADSAWVKRGIGFQPVKFGISFTTSMLNQAGALVLVYADGTVQLNHGGTEMGQGLHTKMLAVCAHELGVGVDKIRMMNTATDKVPNTSATAASSGSDLNGAAIRNACRTLKDRLRPIAAELLGAVDPQTVVFDNGRVYVLGQPDKATTFSHVTGIAYVKQLSLSATGYYRTPGIHYDAKAGRGEPFHYYAFGGAVVEIEVNGLTGEYRLQRVDILHDVGNSLVPTIDRGQVEGGFIQGFGWLTMEELKWSEQGRLLTHGPSTYKIPAVGDAPLDFRVELLDRAPQESVIGGSKAVGEPPFMLAIGAVTALRHAIASFGEAGGEVDLSLPATPESTLRAIEARRNPSAQRSAAS